MTKAQSDIKRIVRVLWWVALILTTAKHLKKEWA